MENFWYSIGVLLAAGLIYLFVEWVTGGPR